MVHLYVDLYVFLYVDLHINVPHPPITVFLILD